MKPRFLIPVLISLSLSAPAMAAKPALSSPVVVREALDLFCKPFLAATPPDYAAATKAGWAYGPTGLFREGDWGRVNVSVRVGDHCDVTVPDGGSHGKELAVLDTVAAWAGAAGFATAQARQTKSGPGPYDTVSQTWTRSAGPNSLTATAYVNRRSEMLLSDVSIHLAAP